MSEVVALRAVMPADIPLFFEHWNQTAGESAAPDAQAREQFAERWARQLADPDMIVRTILSRGEVAGYVAHFTQLGRPAIAYWLGRAFWGRGIATEAVRAFLPMIAARPLFARVAAANTGSLRVLAKAGFSWVEEDGATDGEEGEILLRLG